MPGERVGARPVTAPPPESRCEDALGLPNIYAAAVAVRHLESTAGFPVRTCEGEGVLRQSEIGGEKAAPRFQAGEKLSVNGRVATFLYLSPVGAAVVRYTDETITRVVPAHKLAAAPSRDRP